MDIEAFRQYLESSNLAYARWGDYVVGTIERRLKDANVSADLIKIPAKPRVKSLESALGKLGRKGYSDPLQEMTDLVGVRFVVLLADEVETVCEVIQSEETWAAKRSRDTAAEIERNTKLFDYQSQHFEVRPVLPIELDGETITVDMCCEVQVRTLLQHAYAEMVHDNIYKPSGFVPFKAERHVARSMALMETTDDLFSRTMELLREANGPKVDFLRELTAVYRGAVGDQHLARDDKSASVLADEFRDCIGVELIGQIEALLKQKKYISMKIASRSSSVPLFNQASVLLVYWLALNHDTDDLMKRWPLPGYWGSLKTILSDVDRSPSH